MRIFAIAILLTALLSSCRLFGGKRVRGNGDIVSREQSVGSFNSIDVRGNAKVHLRQGTPAGLKVETDTNLFQYLDIRVDGNTLIVEPRRGYNLRPSEALLVYATAPQFRSIEAAGSCDIVTDNTLTSADLKVEGSGSVNLQLSVDVPRLEASISGSGDALLAGKAANFNGNITGSGNIKAMNLVTNEAALDLSGAASAAITANQTLNVDVSGSGDVVYRGNASVSQRISGSGSVRKLND